jgi:hypothetical protein
VDDGDNGQLTASDFDSYDTTDFGVDNPSFEELSAAADVGASGGASSWDNNHEDGRVAAAAKGLEHNSHKASYKPQVAGRRVLKRASKQRQQASLSQHQLPPDWLELLSQQQFTGSQ